MRHYEMASANGYSIYRETNDEGEGGLKELLRANADIDAPDSVTPPRPAPLRHPARQ